MTIQDQIESFSQSDPFKKYAAKNPLSAEEIKTFLVKFTENHSDLPGTEKVISLLNSMTHSKKNKPIPPMKWFNHLSQIRCTEYLIANSFKISELEASKGTNVLDIKLSDGRYCDVKSFSTTTERMDEPWSYDEVVIKEFAENKIIPAFERQKVDLLVIDDVFSDASTKYGLFIYFLSFLDSELDERKMLFERYLGNYLDKILVLSFTKSLTINPIIRYKGKEFK